VRALGNNSCGIKLDLHGNIMRQRPREVILLGERSVPSVRVRTLGLLNTGRCPGAIVVIELCLSRGRGLALSLFITELLEVLFRQPKWVFFEVDES